MEIWELYTKDREKTGRTMIRGEEQPEGFFRIVVHVCLFDSKGRMLIQKRQPFKDGFSGMWDITVGGSAVSGDTSQMAAHRELLEELGIDADFSDQRPAMTVGFPKGFDDVYILKRDVDIDTLKLQYEEVEKVKWADKEEIFALLDEEAFIPYPKSYIEFLFHLREYGNVHTRKDKTR